MIDRVGRRLFRYPLYQILECFASLNMPKPSGKEIDIIIPVIPKDLAILPYCLDGIRKNIKNKIRDIYIVGPDKIELKDFAFMQNIKFIEETSVLGFSPRDINYITTSGEDRSGWLFQQFLKLSGNIGECEDFITIDSDHILIKPHVFLTSDNKYVFYRSQEFHLQYLISNYKILGLLNIPFLSYVSHKMIFNKKLLTLLKRKIEDRSGLNWIETIKRNIVKEDSSSFSEFELYANFVPSEKKLSKLWLQQAEKRTTILSVDKLERLYPKKLCFTYPDYLNNENN